ncbi:hypothetical protein FRB95_011141 [Tulasnella sp. JGI-2019a]|nr:hypothetical protein FRB95_011141 [Tulasnella sp. JGI-2019a]
MTAAIAEQGKAIRLFMEKGATVQESDEQAVIDELEPSPDHDHQVKPPLPGEIPALCAPAQRTSGDLLPTPQYCQDAQG